MINNKNNNYQLIMEINIENFFLHITQQLLQERNELYTAEDLLLSITTNNILSNIHLPIYQLIKYNTELNLKDENIIKEYSRLNKILTKSDFEVHILNSLCEYIEELNYTSCTVIKSKIGKPILLSYPEKTETLLKITETTLGAINNTWDGYFLQDSIFCPFFLNYTIKVNDNFSENVPLIITTDIKEIENFIQLTISEDFNNTNKIIEPLCETSEIIPMPKRHNELYSFRLYDKNLCVLLNNTNGVFKLFLAHWVTKNINIVSPIRLLEIINNKVYKNLLSININNKTICQNINNDMYHKSCYICYEKNNMFKMNCCESYICTDCYEQFINSNKLSIFKDNIVVCFHCRKNIETTILT